MLVYDVVNFIHKDICVMSISHMISVEESDILKCEIRQLELDKQNLQLCVASLTDKLQTYSWGKSKQDYYIKNKQAIIDRNRERRHQKKKEAQQTTSVKS